MTGWKPFSKGWFIRTVNGLESGSLRTEVWNGEFCQKAKRYSVSATGLSAEAWLREQIEKIDVIKAGMGA